MTDFADDPGGELRRKARALQWVAILETAGYVLLLVFMVLGSRIGIRLVGTVHGMVFLAFAAMVIMIAQDMRWSWWYVAFVIVTGPIGAVLVYERIRHDGVPDPSLTSA
jgi:integral membrane protein